MQGDLPAAIAEACAPLWAELPLEAAMPTLAVRNGGASRLVPLVEEITANQAIASRPALMAGLWLYVDELDRSHTHSQAMPDATGSFWHGIMHRREGDFGNSRYWFSKAGRHAAMDRINGYDPFDFLAAVSADNGQNSPELIAMQRAEWEALFCYSAEHVGAP